MRFKRIPSGERLERRPGAALVSFVAALIVIGSIVLWVLQSTATSATAALAHFQSTGALYAAESGIEMAVRELLIGDNDSDGAAGTISNNGDASDDPALATGAFMVEQVSASPPVYRATGRPVEAAQPFSDFRRVVEARLE
jgi:Tfp pilus assembly protein PilX